MKNSSVEMPVYFMIDGQDGYKTKEEIITHLNNRIKKINEKINQKSA